MLIAGLAFLRAMLAMNKDLSITLAVIAMSLVIAGLTYGYYFFTRVKYYAVGLEDNKRFLVIFDKPTQAAVLEFLDELYDRRKIYYRGEYFHINYENNRKAEIDKMKWLLSENIISENEYNVVVDEINEEIDS